MNRKEFIKFLLGGTALASLPTISWADEPEALRNEITRERTDINASMFGYAAQAIPKVKIGFIGLGNRGRILLEMCQWLIENDFAEIVGLCDLQEEKVKTAQEQIQSWQKNTPTLYFGQEDNWKTLAKQDNVDLLLIATPWSWHTPMSIYGMEQGKHVACEVPIAYTLDDCWLLLKTAIQTRRHCIMIENCCYNEEELFVLQMIQDGVFGEVTHTEGAYLHDLRTHLLSKTYYENQWRIKHHETRNGNLYNTHGLGPISFYLNIGRGDTYDYITSMSSLERNLSLAAKKEDSDYSHFVCGDTNTSLIKTKKLKTILLQYNVHTGRPYSRINQVVGTKAVHEGYPSRLYIDKNPTSHKWLSNTELKTYQSKYEHPMLAKLKRLSKKFKQGHGGMDFVMMYRLIRCLNLGLPLDINVYDSVMWSAITPLSEISVATQSQPLPFPDFTSGSWQKEKDLEIMRNID